MPTVSFEDFYKVPNLNFDITRLKNDLDKILKNKKFTLKDSLNETFIGKGIDDKGLLIAQNLKNQKMVKFSSGEVSLKLKK